MSDVEGVPHRHYAFRGVEPRRLDDPAWEEAQILKRLETFPKIHIARPDGMSAAWRLERKGSVTIGWGDGADHRLLIVRLASRAPRPAYFDSHEGDIA